MKLYRDGELRGHNSAGLEPYPIQRVNHMLGKSHDGTFFHGTMGYLRVWNSVALTAAQVRELFEELPTTTTTSSLTSTASSTTTVTTTTSTTDWASVFYRASVAAEIKPWPSWSHSWDFRILARRLEEDLGLLGDGYSRSLQEDSTSQSPLAVHLQGATLTPTGLYFDGIDQWAYIDPWEFGGPTTIEIFCAFDENATWLATQPVFDFNSGGLVNQVYLRRDSQGALGIFEVGNQDSDGSQQVTDGDFWALGQWTHVVVTMDGQDLTYVSPTFRNS